MLLTLNCEKKVELYFDSPSKRIIFAILELNADFEVGF
jgi:hypothetical protein